MRHEKPPRAATRLLEEFGPRNNQEALAGDLLEAFQQGRSRSWYWRQVLAAIQWRRLLIIFLVWTAFGCYLASLDFHIGSTGWRADLATMMGLLILSLGLPSVLSVRGRICLAVLIIALGFLQSYFIGNIVPEHFPWHFLPLSLIFYRRPRVFYWTFYSGYFVTTDLPTISVRWLLALAAVGAFYFVLDFLRPRLSGPWRGSICLLLVGGSFFLPPFLGEQILFVSLCSIGLLFSREMLRSSRTITLRRLLRNDDHAERRRMIANLEEKR